LVFWYHSPTKNRSFSFSKLRPLRPSGASHNHDLFFFRSAFLFWQQFFLGPLKKNPPKFAEPIHPWFVLKKFVPPIRLKYNDWRHFWKKFESKQKNSTCKRVKMSRVRVYFARTRLSVIAPNMFVIFTHEYYNDTHECVLYTQSIISTRNVI
jgi:hypothetical protein